MKPLFILIALLSSSLILTSCKKDGLGGDGSIDVRVVHHATEIPGATVYLKFGAKEFPGEDLSKYEEVLVTGTAGEQNARGTFKGLLKGNYYLYAVGYDSTINQTVKGGVGVRLDSSSDEVTTDVPVTEDDH